MARPEHSIERPLLRLVKLSSDVKIPGSIVVMPSCICEEEREAVTVGRDRAYGPLLRLKDMQVSKMHASIYFDESLCAFAVTDLGSTTGTFVNDSRLSLPKKSSAPEPLKHLKLLPHRPRAACFRDSS